MCYLSLVKSKISHFRTLNYSIEITRKFIEPRIKLIIFNQNLRIFAN